MEISRQTLVGALFIGGVLVVDGFLLVEERNDPEGMIWVDAGNYTTETGESPTDLVELSGYWIDSEAITEENFRQFVQATEYRSLAENGQEEDRFAHQLPVELADQQTGVANKFHLSFEDAKAYCHWQGKKLSSNVQVRHAGLEMPYTDFHCLQPHRSNDLATLWLKE